MKHEGSWQVSPYNVPDQGLAASKRVFVADCTLRDGEQQPGVVFRREDKLEIAKALDELGVDEIEAGTPAVSGEDREALQEIAHLGLNARVSALALARHDNVDLVAETEAWGIRISLPISPIQRMHKLRLSDEEYLDRASEITEYAKSKQLYVVFSPYDTTRADVRFLERVLRHLARRGTVDRFRLVDTVGAATPHAIRFLTKIAMDASEGIPLEIHCHDDFGLAVANTLAAVEEGAQHVSVTVNGIGERAGNAALEEVVLALHVLYGISMPLHFDRLPQVSALVEERSLIAVHPHKAVVGRNAFSHESGTVVAGILAEPFTAEAYAPSLVGRQREIVLGKKSGTASIRASLVRMGVELTEERVRVLLDRVKALSINERRAVTLEEFRGLVDQIRGS